jgi:hypothetical protein
VDQVGDGRLVAQQNGVEEQLLGVDHQGVQVQPHGHGQALAGFFVGAGDAVGAGVGPSHGDPPRPARRDRSSVRGPVRGPGGWQQLGVGGRDHDDPAVLDGHQHIPTMLNSCVADTATTHNSSSQA